MRRPPARRMEADHLPGGLGGGRIVAYDLLGPTGAEDVRHGPGRASGSTCTSAARRAAAASALALLAASLSYTRELGFARQATIAPERDRPLIAAATQLLGFAVAGRAERLEMLGRVRWSWPLHGSICRARDCRLNSGEISGGAA